MKRAVVLSFIQPKRHKNKMTHYQQEIIAFLGNSLLKIPTLFKSGTWIPADLSVTRMAAFSFPLPASGWKEGRSEREKRERAMTHSHYPLKWKSWKRVLRTQKNTHSLTHTHTHTKHARRGSPGAHLECHHVWCALSSSQSWCVEPQILSQREKVCFNLCPPNSEWEMTPSHRPNGATL